MEKKCKPKKICHFNQKSFLVKCMYIHVIMMKFNSKSIYSAKNYWINHYLINDWTYYNEYTNRAEKINWFWLFNCQLKKKISDSVCQKPVFFFFLVEKHFLTLSVWREFSRWLKKMITDQDFPEFWSVFLENLDCESILTYCYHLLNLLKFKKKDNE